MPLELAGYEADKLHPSQIPIARILRRKLLGRSPETLAELVPNVKRPFLALDKAAHFWYNMYAVGNLISLAVW